MNRIVKLMVSAFGLWTSVAIASPTKSVVGPIDLTEGGGGSGTVAKDGRSAGTLQLKVGAVEASGENLSGLKLAYKIKDSTFKGMFTAYVLAGVKFKKQKFTVTGIVLGGRGYGTAALKGQGSIPVTIE